MLGFMMLWHPTSNDYTYYTYCTYYTYYTYYTYSTYQSLQRSCWAS